MRPLLEPWTATQPCALTGNRTGDPLVRRPALNPLSHTSQGTRVFIRGSQEDQSQTRSCDKEIRSQRERFEDAVLLAWKMEEGPTSQGMRQPLEVGRKRKWILPWSLQKECKSVHALILTPSGPFPPEL